MNPIHDKVIEYLKSKEYWVLIFRVNGEFFTHIIPADSKAGVGRYLKQNYFHPDLMRYWYSVFNSLDPDLSSDLVSSIHSDMQNKDNSLYDAIVEELWECEGRELEVFHKIIKSNLDAYSDKELVNQMSGMNCDISDISLDIVKCSGPISL